MSLLVAYFYFLTFALYILLLLYSICSTFHIPSWLLSFAFITSSSTVKHSFTTWFSSCDYICSIISFLFLVRFWMNSSLNLLFSLFISWRSNSMLSCMSFINLSCTIVLYFIKFFLVFRMAGFFTMLKRCFFFKSFNLSM